MKISLVQMNVTADKAANLARAKELAKRTEGADIVMLPEMFCCPYGPRHFVENAEPCGGPVTDALREIAMKTGSILVGGSMPELEDGRIYNTCFVFGGDGELLARHRKAHLFDVDIKGGQRFFESETLTKGEGATAVETVSGRIEVAICFDIRFSAFINSVKPDILCVPAAFNMTTGPLHWELLFRARAVDNQCFAFGCAPARDVRSSYVSYANSIAVDPWGRVIGNAGTGETVLTVEFDPDEAKRVREQIPLKEQ